MIQPEALNKLLSSQKKSKTVIIHTGPATLFKAGHIPGALSVRQTADSSGIANLKETLHKISKDKQIVLYCGCCPWKNCPNIRPAYSAVQEMGFKNVKVLNLPTTFKLDWVKKGFPVEK